MSIRKLIAGAAIAAPLLLGGPAFADVLTSVLNASGGGEVALKFTNYENFSTQTIGVGTQNFGVFVITSIYNPNNNITYYNEPLGGATGDYMVGVFGGITIQSVNGGVTENTGGTFNIYQVSNLPDFSQALAGYAAAGGGCTVGSLCYNGVSNTAGGTDVLNYNLVPGADSDPTSTLHANISGTTVPVTGSAFGYGDVTGGADAGLISGASFLTALGTLAQINITDDFCATGTQNCPTQGWQQKSEDPVYVSLVPEPGSIGILGTALLSLGFFGMRGKRKDSSQ